MSGGGQYGSSERGRSMSQSEIDAARIAEHEELRRLRREGPSEGMERSSLFENAIHALVEKEAEWEELFGPPVNGVTIYEAERGSFPYMLGDKLLITMRSESGYDLNSSPKGMRENFSIDVEVDGRLQNPRTNTTLIIKRSYETKQTDGHRVLSRPTYTYARLDSKVDWEQILKSKPLELPPGSINATLNYNQVELETLATHALQWKPISIGQHQA